MLVLLRPLIIFEMANNHQGSIEHGKLIIREMHEASKGYDFDFAIKFQYRNLDTFIHPDFKDRKDVKYIKRFLETRLYENEFLELKKESESYGFKTVCTPFDEVSVDKIVKHKFDFIKIASASIRDWPLLEKIATISIPIIASTGGGEIKDVDNVVSFLRHKNKDFALMHCVGIYPTENADLTMNRIDWFHSRYRDIPIGFSTHEKPNEFFPTAIAVSKNAKIFEKHVGVETDTIKLNKYSATPDQVKNWLHNIKTSLEICGPTNLKYYKIKPEEIESLISLKRGAFAKRDTQEGEIFKKEDVFFAMPNSKGQLTAEYFSKFNLKFKATKNYKKNDAIDSYLIEEVDVRSKIAYVIHTMNSQLNQAGIVVNENSDVELSHHYGVENIDETGAILITCINREYAKKLVIQVPGQFHPEHRHEIKEETFQILWGMVNLKNNGETKKYYPGEIVTIAPNDLHSFWTEDGVIFEEVSTTHRKEDSYYTDPEIAKNTKRKTNLKDWWMLI